MHQLKHYFWLGFPFNQKVFCLFLKVCEITVIHYYTCSTAKVVGTLTLTSVPPSWLCQRMLRKPIQRLLSWILATSGSRRCLLKMPNLLWRKKVSLQCWCCYRVTCRVTWITSHCRVSCSSQMAVTVNEFTVYQNCTWECKAHCVTVKPDAAAILFILPKQQKLWLCKKGFAAFVSVFKMWGTVPRHNFYMKNCNTLAPFHMVFCVYLWYTRWLCHSVVHPSQWSRDSGGTVTLRSDQERQL